MSSCKNKRFGLWTHSEFLFARYWLLIFAWLLTFLVDVMLPWNCPQLPLSKSVLTQHLFWLSYITWTVKISYLRFSHGSQDICNILPQGHQTLLVKKKVKCLINICLSYLSVSPNILHSITTCLACKLNSVALVHKQPQLVSKVSSNFCG
jgi:hypothetical protein